MADRHPMALFGLLAVAVAGLYLFNLSISPGFTADEVRYAQLSQHIVTFNAISLTGPFLVHPPWTFSRCAVAQHHRSRIRPGAVRADQHQVFSAACCVFTALGTGILARDLLSTGTRNRRREPDQRSGPIRLGPGGFRCWARMWQRGEMDVSRVTARTMAVSVLAVAAGAGLITASPAAAASPVQDAVVSAVASAASDDITQSVSVVDRVTGARVASSGGDQQYISESIVKLFTVAYYEVKAGGRPDQSMATRLRTMIIHSDDAIESSLWNVDIVPAMAARYGLANTSNGPKTGPHDWGWELITADDEADFLFKMSIDPEVAPLLMDAMANVAPTGSDGFDQSFGLNSLTGDHGSKQGWTDIGSTQRVQIHSVGWTDKFFVAILQTSTSSDYDTMRADSTRTAQAVLAAEEAGPTGTAGDDPTGTSTVPTPDTSAAEAATPAASASPATSEPAPASASPGPTIAAAAPAASPAVHFFAALRAVGRDIGAAVTALFKPLTGD